VHPVYPEHEAEANWCNRNW